MMQKTVLFLIKLTVCLRVCMCERVREEGIRERERERDREREREREREGEGERVKEGEKE